MVDILGHPAGSQQMGEPSPLRGRAGGRVRPRAIDNALIVFHGQRTYPSSCLLCWVGCPPSSDHTGISASVWGLFSPHGTQSLWTQFASFGVRQSSKSQGKSQLHFSSKDFLGPCHGT